MLQLDPFGYFPEHASVFSGLGGQHPAPDGRYAFHTAYTSATPGLATFRLRLQQVVAEPCELNVRVLAHRPGLDIMMATSARIYLDGSPQEEVEQIVRFLAVEDVEYAFYGFLTEPVQVSASSIDIGLVSLGPAKDGKPLRSRASRFIERDYLVSAGKLYSSKPPTLLRPMSQAYSREQDVEIARHDLWPEIARELDSGVERWRLVMPMQVLAQAGMTDPPVSGILLNPPAPTLHTALQRRGCEMAVITESQHRADRADLYGTADFVIGYGSSIPVQSGSFLMDDMLDLLAGGGLAIAVFSLPATVEEHVFRNAVQQIALYLLGKGLGVAQIAKCGSQSWHGPTGTEGAFALVVRK